MEDEEVKQLVRSIQIAEHLEDADIVVKNANVEIADGLMSEIIRVTIRKSGEPQVHLIVKVAPAGEDVQCSVEMLFTCETHFYTAIMPELNKLQRKHTGKDFTFVPRHFKSVCGIGKQRILIEDVCPRGFVMLDRQWPFSDAHSIITLQRLGEFHALSFALQKHEPEKWAQLENGIDPNVVFQGEVVDWFTESLDKAILLSNAMNKPCIAAKLKHTREHFSEVLARMFTPSKKYPSVFAHLDIWCNNLLFKHSDCERQVPSDVVLIDFQQITKASPILDVSCFLYINGSINAITNWKDFARIYHDSLVAHGKRLDCKIETLYSWEMFMDDWKDYCHYAMLKSIMGISINARDLEEIKDAGFFHVKTLNRKSAERIWHFISHMDHEGFL